MITKPIPLFVIEAIHSPEGEFQRLSVSAWHGAEGRCGCARVPSALLAPEQTKVQILLPEVLLPSWPVFHKRERIFFFFWYDNQCKDLVSSEDFSSERTEGFCRFGRFANNK